MTNKLILDVCCGGRQFWFNKQHPATVYSDIRKEGKGCLKIRPNFSVQPDVIMDFKALAILDKKFKLIIWDPPHICRRALSPSSVIQKKYGVLIKKTWKSDLTKGFNEIWRALDIYGTLIFKWSESDIPLNDVLECFKEKPLIGHRTTKNGKTIWCVFFKSKP